LGSQNLGGCPFFKRFDYCLNKSKLNTDEKEQIKNKAKTAVHAIVAYTNWLKI
jgi:hypothetical protein